MSELAQVVSEVSGQQVTCTDFPVEAYTRVLVGVGLPGPVAAVYADGDRGVADGELLVEGEALERLVGRPATPLAQAVRSALSSLRGSSATG